MSLPELAMQSKSGVMKVQVFMRTAERNLKK